MMFASAYWPLSPVPKSPRTRNFREFGRLGRAVAPSPALPDDTATPPCGAVPCCDAAGTTRAMANISEATSVQILVLVIVVVIGVTGGARLERSRRRCARVRRGG